MLSGRCQVHSDRPGVGVCVECKRVVCRECTTQHDGINRCAQCLDKRLAQARKPRARAAWSAGAVVSALIAFGLIFGGALALGVIFKG